MDNWRTYSGHFADMGTLGEQILHFWTSIRNIDASNNQSPSRFEDMIYSALDHRGRFREQLISEQQNDPIITAAAVCVSRADKINAGRLKRVQSQLRLEDGILPPSGRPLVPASLRKFVTSHVHDSGHWGSGAFKIIEIQKFLQLW